MSTAIYSRLPGFLDTSHHVHHSSRPAMSELLPAWTKRPDAIAVGIPLDVGFLTTAIYQLKFGGPATRDRLTRSKHCRRDIGEYSFCICGDSSLRIPFSLFENAGLTQRDRGRLPEMELSVVSHVNGDGDLLEAWLKYYRRLGVSSFHLVVHGPREENERLYALKDSHPVIIEDAYEGPFEPEEKKRRLNSLLARMRGRWLLVVDSDEFVEFPYPTISATIRRLRLVGRNALFAPMVQHLSSDGSLDSPEVVEDPFRIFPLCSVDLYQIMGVQASISKWPLFFCTNQTLLREGGNHNCPAGNTASSMLGVTHHFKFRRSVSQRLDRRIHSAHPWRHESVQFQKYLESHANRLPTTGAFAYSRDELLRRGLLRKFTSMTVFRHVLRSTGRLLGKDARTS
jgi:hypothetical protein